MLQLGNYDVALYMEYLIRFSNDTVTDALKVKVKNYLDSELKKDILIKDMLSSCKRKFENGGELPVIMASLAEDFAYFELADRVNISEYEYFFEGYITDSIRKQVFCEAEGSTRQTSLATMRELITNFLNLSDSYYKAAMGLSILRFSWGLQFANDLSFELLDVLDYVNTYDLEDMKVQETLINTFTLI